MDKSFADKIGLVLGSKGVITQGDLADRIIAIVRKKERLAALTKTAIFGILSAFAVSLLVLVWYTQSSAIMSSEVIKLLSLAFSDTAVILSYWKEYVWSFLGSVPFVSIAFLGACLWLLFASVHMTIKNSKILFNHAIWHA